MTTIHFFSDDFSSSMRASLLVFLQERKERDTLCTPSHRTLPSGVVFEECMLAGLTWSLRSHPPRLRCECVGALVLEVCLHACDSDQLAASRPDKAISHFAPSAILMSIASEGREDFWGGLQKEVLGRDCHEEV